MSPRIPPLEPPFPDDAAPILASMMPPGVPPIGLFRTFAHNLPMAQAMRGWGGYELSKQLSLSMRDREIIIDRTCARCGCEYEWGVHVAFFAERAALTEAQISSLTHGDSNDACWTDRRDVALLCAVDSLHDTNDFSDELWRELRAHFDESQILDLIMLTGWYHAISFAARALRVDLESGAPRFTDAVGR
jgi:alkylhydroperoxidase family enzyme